jgi:hypothetical protein
MNTYDNPATRASTHPRVWLAGGIGSASDPIDHPTVRDNRMRTWQAGVDGRYHSTDGWHHANWTDLRARFDLVEVVVPATVAA